MQDFANKELRVLVVMLTSVVEGKTEKGGGGKAVTAKPVDSGANVSDNSPAGTVKTPSPAFSKTMMKNIADMAAMLAMSGGLSMMLVALKYYAMKAAGNLVESMTGLGYADDP